MRARRHHVRWAHRQLLAGAELDAPVAGAGIPLEEMAVDSVVLSSGSLERVQSDADTRTEICKIASVRSLRPIAIEELDHADPLHRGAVGMLVRGHPNVNLADFLVGCACAAAGVRRGPWAGLHLSSEVLALLCVAVCSLDVVTFELATRHSCSTASFTQRHARVVASIVGKRAWLQALCCRCSARWRREGGSKWMLLTAEDDVLAGQCKSC